MKIESLLKTTDLFYKYAQEISKAVGTGLDAKIVAAVKKPVYDFAKTRYQGKSISINGNCEITVPYTNSPPPSGETIEFSWFLDTNLGQAETDALNETIKPKLAEIENSVKNIIASDSKGLQEIYKQEGRPERNTSPIKFYVQLYFDTTSGTIATK
jgi:hypothetical protein